MTSTKPDSSPVLKSGTTHLRYLKKKRKKFTEKLFGIIFSLVVTGEEGRVPEVHVELATATYKHCGC